MPSGMLGDILTEWRHSTKLTQEQLSALTYEVANWLRESGYPDSTGLRRQHIDRLENSKVKEPEHRTLRVLAFAFVEAANRQGRQIADGETLYQLFLSHTRAQITVRDVSPQAAEMDSVMMMVGEPARSIFYAGLLANARALVDAQRLSRSQSANAT